VPVIRFEHEARQRGKASFHFAWVLDQHDEERERGVTVDVATSYFETPKYQVTLLDAPGHKDFVPNMITGASQADVGILVVPAPAGEFDKGFGDNGQTKEHALLARSLGVGQLIVAVNKMDSVGWDQARFESVKEQLAPFLKKTGFKDDSISFVPVSGMTGENINQQTVAELLAWYHGPTLAERIGTRHLLNYNLAGVSFVTNCALACGCRLIRNS
jgi:elongation factor 1 alpha-like protein